MSKKELIKTIKNNTNSLSVYGVKRMGVFGSFATRHQTPKSDIDILVEFKSGHKTFDNYMGLKLYLEKLFRRKVDLVIKDALKSQIKERVLLQTIYA